VVLADAQRFRGSNQLRGATDTRWCHAGDDRRLLQEKAEKILASLPKELCSSDALQQQGIAARLRRKFVDADLFFHFALNRAEVEENSIFRQGQIWRDRAMLYVDMKLPGSTLSAIERSQELFEQGMITSSDISISNKQYRHEIAVTIGFEGRIRLTFDREGGAEVAVELFREADAMLYDHPLYRLNNLVWWLKTERRATTILVTDDDEQEIAVADLAMQLASSGETRNFKRRTQIYLLRRWQTHWWAKRF